MFLPQKPCRVKGASIAISSTNEQIKPFPELFVSREGGVFFLLLHTLQPKKKLNMERWFIPCCILIQKPGWETFSCIWTLWLKISKEASLSHCCWIAHKEAVSDPVTPSTQRQRWVGLYRRSLDPCQCLAITFWPEITYFLITYRLQLC